MLKAWNQPVEPFKIIGNVYYVGATEVTSFLITTPEGHILIDSGLAETAPQIRSNIQKLGFHSEDIRLLLSIHAHYDHAGGLAALKQDFPNARLIAVNENADELERGGTNDFAFGDRQAFAPVDVDQRISDGGDVALGGVKLKAVLTPGHTKGCTTWLATIADGSRLYHVVWACSLSAPGYNLVDNQNYPRIVEDYRKTFKKLASLPCDVLLAPHGSAFGLTKKRALREAGGPNPFIDPAELAELIRKTSQDFEAQLAEQQKHSEKEARQ